MSVSTPILTTSSDTCAVAAAGASIAAANAPSTAKGTAKVLANILFPPGGPAPSDVLVWAGIGLSFKHSLAPVNAAESMRAPRQARPIDCLWE
jgi:hypothetical protein